MLYHILYKDKLFMTKNSYEECKLNINNMLPSSMHKDCKIIPHDKLKISNTK